VLLKEKNRYSNTNITVTEATVRVRVDRKEHGGRVAGEKIWVDNFFGNFKVKTAGFYAFLLQKTTLVARNRA